MWPHWLLLTTFFVKQDMLRYESQDVRFLAEEKLSSQDGSPYFYLIKPLLWHLMKHSPSVCTCAIHSAQTVKWAQRSRLLFCVLFFGLWCRIQDAYLELQYEHHTNYRMHSTTLKSYPSFLPHVHLFSQKFWFQCQVLRMCSYIWHHHMGGQLHKEGLLGP